MVEETRITQKIILDDWQKDILHYEGNICLCTGRQVGKSTVISIRAAISALKHGRSNILIIAATERQAQLLFQKTLGYLHDNHKAKIKAGKERPTKHEIRLKNGSNIYCLPTGQTGYGIRGYTIHDLYADEAHFIPEDVWAAVTPMLATTGGRINLLSTADLTKGRDGYFYRCSLDENFKFFSISSIAVAEGRAEPQRSNMLDHIERERKRLTEAQFAAEYLGQFVDQMFQFFSNDWIEKVCVEEPIERMTKNSYLGVDIGGMGEDPSAFQGFESGKIIKQIYCSLTNKTRTTETTQKILSIDRQHKFRKIGIDTGGMGVGVYDQLLTYSQTRHKVKDLNNAKRVMEEERRIKLQKEAMYMLTLALGEQGRLRLWNTPEIKEAFRSIKVDPDADGLRLSGDSDHIVEGVNRGVWLAEREKSLNLFVY